MKNNKKIVVISLLLAAIASVSIWLLFTRENTSTDDPTTGQDYVNLEPATEEEREYSESKKTPETNTPSQNTPEDNSDKESVTPVITNTTATDTTIEVRSFIPGIYETGGMCTAVFEQGSNKIEREVEAIAEATTTRCDTVAVEKNSFPSDGTWSVVITYSSDKYFGGSESREVEI